MGQARQRCGRPAIWLCYRLIAKPDNKIDNIDINLQFIMASASSAIFTSYIHTDLLDTYYDIHQEHCTGMYIANTEIMDGHLGYSVHISTTNRATHYSSIHGRLSYMAEANSHELAFTYLGYIK